MIFVVVPFFAQIVFELQFLIEEAGPANSQHLFFIRVHVVGLQVAWIIRAKDAGVGVLFPVPLGAMNNLVVVDVLLNGPHHLAADLTALPRSCRENLIAPNSFALGKETAEIV